MTPSRHPLFLVALLVALVAALGGGAWWLTHPDVFDDAGGIGMTTRENPVGRTTYFGILSSSADEERRELELRSATPVVGADTAEAELEVYLCEVDPRQPLIGVGSQWERPTDLCRVFEPVTDGARMVIGEDEPRHELVLAVRPTQPGVVKVRGLEVSYRDGLRRGTEVTGAHVVHRAR